MRTTDALGLVLLTLGCSAPVAATRARITSVRIYTTDAPRWRYRTLATVEGTGCGSALIAGSDDDARTELRGRAADLGAHALLNVVCHRGAAMCGWNSVVCEGDAIQWLPGQ